MLVAIIPDIGRSEEAREIIVPKALSGPSYHIGSKDMKVRWENNVHCVGGEVCATKLG